MKLLVLFIHLLAFISAEGQTKVDKSTKKEITEFISEFRLAIIENDTIWIKEHTNNETYQLILKKTDSFSSEELITNLSMKFTLKHKITRKKTDYVISFGKYSEVTDYPGGAALIRKINDSWQMITYRCRY